MVSPRSSAHNKRLARSQFPDNERDEGRGGSRDAPRDRVRAEPIQFLLLIEHELKGCEPERKKAKADVIDAARIHRFRWGGSSMKAFAIIPMRSPHREVDVKDPRQL